MTTLCAIKIYLSLSKTLQRLFQKNQSFGRASIDSRERQWGRKKEFTDIMTPD